jgi:hypothetical protein
LKSFLSILRSFKMVPNLTATASVIDILHSIKNTLIQMEASTCYRAYII